MTVTVTGSAISLNVAEPEASAAFLVQHLGHAVEMRADGFVSLSHPSGGSNVVLLRTGLASFKPAEVAGPAGSGLLLAFVVEGLDAAHERLVAAGVPVVTPPETEPWGERYVQYRDPNGLVVQLVEWV